MISLARTTTLVLTFSAATLLGSCTKTLPTEVLPSIVIDDGPVVAYLAAYMTATDEAHLYYALSTDGFHFDELVNEGRPILAATLDDKRLRDPMIFRDRARVYHMVATVSWSHPYFTIWDSDDLVTWKNERLVGVAPPGASMVWAPEVVYDAEADDYLVYWTSALGDFATASIYFASTKDFRSFSSPQVMLSDPTAAIMDATVVFDGANYHMFYRSNGVRHATAMHATGPYGHAELLAEDNVEGPFVFRLNDSSGWGMVWDYFEGNAGYGLLRSADLFTWERISNPTAPYDNGRVSFPAGIRHGSIIPVSQAQVDALRRLRR